MFNSVDADKDGQITLAEFIALMWNIYWYRMTYVTNITSNKYNL